MEISEQDDPVTGVRIVQNYPNPFTDVTNITVHLTSATNLTLEVFSLADSRILTLPDLHQDAGEQVIPLNTSTWKPGFYFVILTAYATRVTRKMVKIP